MVRAMRQSRRNIVGHLCLSVRLIILLGSKVIWPCEEDKSSDDSQCDRHTNTRNLSRYRGLLAGGDLGKGHGQRCVIQASDANARFFITNLFHK